MGLAFCIVTTPMLLSIIDQFSPALLVLLPLLHKLDQHVHDHSKREVNMPVLANLAPVSGKKVACSMKPTLNP